MRVALITGSLALLPSCGGLSAYPGADAAGGACDTSDPGCTTTDTTDGDSDTDADSDADTDTDPESSEDCTDGVDNNANGLRDCDDPACFPVCDEDADGVTADIDCDDDEATVYPGADVLCDGLDNDCDGAGDDSEDGDNDGAAVCDDCADSDGSRFPGAAEACDGVDSDCDGADAPRWSWDFEAGPPLGAPFSTSGDANWGVNMTQPHLGSYSGNSGAIANNEATFLSLSLSMCVAGTVSFWHAESSEASYDFLKFAIDGVEQQRWSGINAVYQQNAYNLAAGVHSLEWVYSKDASVSSGSDAVWVDDIEVVGGAP